MKTLAERLISIREKKGFTQLQLSELSGVSQQLIHKIESGKTKKTSFILQLAIALKVNPQWLQFGEGSPDFLASSYFGNNLIFIPVIEWVQIDRFLDISAQEELENSISKRIAIISHDYCIDKRCFALKVNSDAMVLPSPNKHNLFNGDIVVINPDYHPEPNNLVLCRIQNDYQIRQYIKDGTNEYLRIFNQDYPDTYISFDHNTMAIVGIIIKIDRPLYTLSEN